LWLRKSLITQGGEPGGLLLKWRESACRGIKSKQAGETEVKGAVVAGNEY